MNETKTPSANVGMATSTDDAIMPPTVGPVIYLNGFVYRVYNDIDALCYIGSTKNTIEQRMAGHCSAARCGAQQLLQMHMRALGIEHFDIEVLEETGPTTREMLRKLEHQWIVKLDTVRTGLNDKYEDQFCEEHGRIRGKCVPCGGSQVCRHAKQLCRCVECGGSQICGHDKRWELCSICDGRGMCDKHPQTQKSQCIPCKAASTCRHARLRYYCGDCGGAGFCQIHNRRKDICHEGTCRGSRMCNYTPAKQIDRCNVCPGGGSSNCAAHGVYKYTCARCRPCQYCPRGANGGKHLASAGHLKRVAEARAAAAADEQKIG